MTDNSSGENVDAMAALRDGLARCPDTALMMDVPAAVVRALYQQAREEADPDGLAARLLAVCELWGATPEQSDTVTVSRWDAAGVLDPSP